MIEIWHIQWMNSEYPEAGWHPLGSIPAMPIAEAIEVMSDFVNNEHLAHLNWRIVNDAGEEIYDAIL